MRKKQKMNLLQNEEKMEAHFEHTILLFFEECYCLKDAICFEHLCKMLLNAHC